MKRRAGKSVGIFAYESYDARGPVPRSFGEVGFSPIFITAGLAILILVAAVGWEIVQALPKTGSPIVSTQNLGNTGSNLNTISPLNSTTSATTTDPLSSIGGIIVDQLEGAYQQMQSTGTYSTSTAEQAAQSLAPYVTADVSYPTFSASDIKTDTATSYARMLEYRSDLRASLAPLLKNTQPEYEIFAYYVSTKDATYLKKLQSVAADYRAAATATAKVIVPSDAVSYHVAILNAMEEFGATLDAMAGHADDPFASVALLRSYDKAEADMLTSFNDLTGYYKSKTP